MKTAVLISVPALVAADNAMSNNYNHFATPLHLQGHSFTEVFTEFKSKFGKTYHSAAEEFTRFKNFIINMEKALKLRLTEGGTASYGHHSPMADLSAEEFRKLNLMAVSPQVLAEHEKKAEKHSKQLMKLHATTLPTNFDWRDKGAVNEVKNQAQCGSCWAFGTVASIEGANWIANGELLSLSEQELVDCSTSDSGCGGGLPSRAYEDLIDTNSGLELENVYPYQASDGTCQAKRSLERVFLNNWYPIKQDENLIAQALMMFGPLAIGVNADPFQMYNGGIMDPSSCSPNGIDHAVTLVGFGNEGGRDFWTIRNSWGKGWGENGYVRLIRGKGACGMNLMVTAVEVTKKEKKMEMYL